MSITQVVTCDGPGCIEMLENNIMVSTGWLDLTIYPAFKLGLESLPLRSRHFHSLECLESWVLHESD